MSTKAKNNHIIDKIMERFDLHIDANEATYVSDKTQGNLKVHPLYSRNCTALIRNYFRSLDIRLTRDNLKELLSEIEAEALFSNNNLIQPRNRVAIDGDRLVLDCGDDNNSRIVFQDGKYSVETSGIDVPFLALASTQALCLPDDILVIDEFYNFLNFSFDDSLLALSWVTFIMSHPKSDNVSYPILVIKAQQGSGKTSLCKVLRKIIDPRNVGVQKMPKNIESLSVMASAAHLLIFDNVRSFTLDMSDNLCLTSTGGSRSARKLYTDNDESVINLQVPVILNGIHAFIGQSDLAERCLTFNLQSIPSCKRRSEQELSQELKNILPRMMAGIFELIAITLAKLPDAKVTSPERMMDFSQWIAATELALPECHTYCYRNVQIGDIQEHYSSNLKQASFDNLHENEFSAAIIEFAENHKNWTGTPTNLFHALESAFDDEYSKSQYYPKTPIALSKKLKPLIIALASQGVIVEFTRGTERKISIYLDDDD